VRWTTKLPMSSYVTHMMMCAHNAQQFIFANIVRHICVYFGMSTVCISTTYISAFCENMLQICMYVFVEIQKCKSITSQMTRLFSSDTSLYVSTCLSSCSLLNMAVPWKCSANCKDVEFDLIHLLSAAVASSASVSENEKSPGMNIYLSLICTGF